MYHRLEDKNKRNLEVISELTEQNARIEQECEELRQRPVSNACSINVTLSDTNTWRPAVEITSARQFSEGNGARYAKITCIR